jgi:hypothetical protein
VTVSERGRAQVWDAVTGHTVGEPMGAPEDKLIKDLREFLTKVPQDDRAGPGTPCAWPNGLLSRAKERQ